MSYAIIQFPAHKMNRKANQDMELFMLLLEGDSECGAIVVADLGEWGLDQYAGLVEVARINARGGKDPSWQSIHEQVLWIYNRALVIFEGRHS